MAARRNQPDDDPAIQSLINASLNAFFGLTPQRQLAVVGLLILLGAIAAVIYYRSPYLISGGASDTGSNLVLGNPSNATADSSVRDNYLMVKPYFDLSYNESKGTPNWVSWCVTESDLGDAPRKEEFDEDLTLPSDFFRVVTHDYSSSGFDRGHMCPHSDRAGNLQMSYATFVMSNIIPQAPNVNRKAWAQMEDYCRVLVRNHDRLYIIAGPAGEGGRGSRGVRQTLAGGHVTVPSSCWKVVVDVPDQGNDDLSQITESARVLTVEIPNDNDVVDEEWEQYRTTPARVEQETGLRFFTNLRPELQQALRKRLDQMPLPAPRRIFHEKD